MDDKLYEILSKLPAETLLNLVWSSLDEMQSYNGQSKQEAILKAIGATRTDSGGWRIPEAKQIAENCQSSFLE